MKKKIWKCYPLTHTYGIWIAAVYDNLLYSIASIPNVYIAIYQLYDTSIVRVPQKVSSHFHTCVTIFMCVCVHDIDVRILSLAAIGEHCHLMLAHRL